MTRLAMFDSCSSQERPSQSGANTVARAPDCRNFWTREFSKEGGGWHQFTSDRQSSSG